MYGCPAIVTVPFLQVDRPGYHVAHGRGWLASTQAAGAGPGPGHCKASIIIMAPPAPAGPGLAPGVPICRQSQDVTSTTVR